MPTPFGTNSVGEEAVKGPLNRNERCFGLSFSIPADIPSRYQGSDREAKGKNKTFWDEVKSRDGKAETE